MWVGLVVEEECMQLRVHMYIYKHAHSMIQ